MYQWKLRACLQAIEQESEFLSSETTLVQSCRGIPQLVQYIKTSAVQLYMALCHSYTHRI